METSKTYPQISVRVSEEDKARIDAAAEREHLPTSSFVRSIVLKEVERLDRLAARDALAFSEALAA